MILGLLFTFLKFSIKLLSPQQRETPLGRRQTQLGYKSFIVRIINNSVKLKTKKSCIQVFLVIIPVGKNITVFLQDRAQRTRTR